MKKLVALSMVGLMTISLFGCAQKDVSTELNTDKQEAQVKTTSEEDKKDTKVDKPEIIELKFLSNLPDRTSGQGLVEQKLIDLYQSENENVKIVIEALQDEPYKQKFKAYAATNQLPDVYHVWGQPAFFKPVMEAGYAAELNKEDFASYGFFEGSLDGFSHDGKLYGLPRNTDVMVMFYNNALFEECGVEVPKTFDDLMDATEKFLEKDIAPCAINGKDRWTIGLLYQELLAKVGGDQKLIHKAIQGEVAFEGNEDLLRAAEILAKLNEIGFFQKSFISADYGIANNLFAQEKTAMYYMGSWEMGMVTNDTFPQHFRDNMSVMAFPTVKDGKGQSTDLIAWNGGGYAASSSSSNKAEAIKFLNFVFEPEHWANEVWSNGVCIPAQKYDAFLTGEETSVQRELTQILSDSTSVSGTSWFDSYTPNFKVQGETLSQELLAGLKSPEEFLKACEEVSKETR